MPRERINRAMVDDLAVNNLIVLGTIQVAGGAAAIQAATGTLVASPATSTPAASSTPGGDGSAMTNLNASALATGTVAPARMGSGSPSSSTYLRGDGSWSTPPAAPVTKVAGRTGDVVLAAGDVSGLASVATSGAYGDLSGKPTLPALAGGKLSITGSGTVTPAGLASIASVVVSLGQDPSLSAARATATWSGTTVTIKVWKPTSALDGTPIAATTAAVVNWVAYGS